MNNLALKLDERGNESEVPTNRHNIRIGTQLTAHFDDYNRYVEDKQNITIEAYHNGFLYDEVESRWSLEELLTFIDTGKFTLVSQ